MTIILCLALLILIFLLINIRVVIKYKDGLYVHVKFLFFNFDILKLSKKLSQKPKEKKQPPEQSKSFLKILKMITKGLNTNLFDLKKGVIISKLYFKLDVGIDDAKDTALLCGHIYNALSLIDTLLTGDFSVKEKNISITPKFNEMCFKPDFELDIKASVVNLASIALLIFINISRK